MRDRWSFLMVTPDGVLAGQLGRVVAGVEALGFEVRATRLLELDYARLARMYAHSDHPPVFQESRNELPKRVVTALYKLAPACVLVLGRTAGDATGTLLRHKGATRPEEAGPETIRVAGEHLIFNYVHCPDDPEAAAIELGYLVGVEPAAAFVAIATSPREPASEALLGLAQLQRCLPAFSGPEALAFPFVANRLRARLVQHLAPASEGVLLEAQALLASEREALLQGASAAERLATAQAAHPRLHALLREAAGADDVLVAGLDALAALYDVAGTRQLLPILALRERGLYLSETERVAIDAHRHAYWAEEHPPADLTG